MSKLQVLEIRLHLESRYEDSDTWEQPFLLFAEAEAEAGFHAVDQLLRSFGQ